MLVNSAFADYLGSRLTHKMDSMTVVYCGLKFDRNTEYFTAEYILLSCCLVILFTRSFSH